MLEKFKTYLVQVIAKRVAPQVATSISAMVITFIVAHQEILEKMGITYYPDFDGTWHGAMPTGKLLVLEFDTLTNWGALALVAGAAALWAIVQHHSVATVTGAPQSGDARKEPDIPVVGGDRKEDIKGELN